MPLIFLMYALFASVFVIGKYSLLYASPLFLVGTRMTIAGFFMLLLTFTVSKERVRPTMSQLFTIVRLAFFNIYFTNIFEFWGLKYLTSAKTCFIYGFSPFLSALLSYFLFSERQGKMKWIGLILGFIGLIPLILTSSKEEFLGGSFSVFSFAEISVFLATLSSVYGWILLKKLVFQEKMPLLFVNGLSMFIGGVGALTHSFFVDVWDPIPVTDLFSFVKCSLLLLLVSNCICYNLYGFLLKRFSATLMSFAGFITPFFTALFGYIFLEETIGVGFYLASVLVFSGLFLFYFEELKQERKSALEPI